ncbi:Autophagy-related protein 13 [Heterocephalus glaber]|uniref:Autophagy-related protein 13 n=1 Tax=Heterocephalus glaber TaxID=10181 RepID=G5ATG8_HETGA|nr:Autophagy-related protein 13 [Heterocephalus glaber]
MNEKCDKEIKVSYTIYNRLSLLLKSLLSITRVTPAYRLSRKQGHEYVILYRIYFGEVQLNGLGEGFQAVRVGTVGTPVGTITLSCAYRINLAFMSTRQFDRTPPTMGIIIDHFVDHPYPSSSPRHPFIYRIAGEDAGGVYLSVEDSQELCTTSFSTSPPSQLMVPGKEWGVPVAPSQPTHGAQADQERLAIHTPSDGPHCASTPSSSEGTETVSNSSEGPAYPHNVLETIFVRKVGVFVNKPINQVSPSDSPEAVSPLHSSLHSEGSSEGSSGNPHDDFVMIDFKPAFSKDDILPMDLGTFYRQEPRTGQRRPEPQLRTTPSRIGFPGVTQSLSSCPTVSVPEAQEVLDGNESHIGGGQLALLLQPGCIHSSCGTSQMPQLQPGPGSLASHHPLPEACMKMVVPTVLCCPDYGLYGPQPFSRIPSMKRPGKLSPDLELGQEEQSDVKAGPSPQPHVTEP